MKIEKDAEWLRLEGKVGQLCEDLSAAKKRLTLHANKTFCAQAGLVPGETVVACYKTRYLFVGVDRAEYGWILGVKFNKDGKPAKNSQNLYNDWTKEA
jgi:hypothetical protein